MEPAIVMINVFDKRENITETLYVEQLAENTFRMPENSLFNCRLTIGTEFITRINKDGAHEIIKLTKDSEFITRRFFLTTQFTSADYMVLGEEIVKHGGFWQVDFGSTATVNLPKNSTLDLDAIFKIFDFKLSEIVD